MGSMMVLAGAVLALAALQASAAQFSFESTEAVPSSSFNYDSTTGILTSVTDVPLTIRISGINTTMDSKLEFAAMRVSVQAIGGMEVWGFDGGFQFKTLGGVLILSAQFTNGMTLTMTGTPLSGIQASSTAPSTLDYTPGAKFKEIAGSVLGFDSNDPNIILDLVDPQSMGFTLTGVLPVVSPVGFDADSSFSGNADIAVTVVPEPATMAMLGLGALMMVRRKVARSQRAV